MEPEEQKLRPKRRSRIIPLILVLLPLSCALYVILTLLDFDFPYSVIRSIVPAPVVTPVYSAQELWDNPLPTPEWISRVKSIYDDPPYLYDFFDYPFCVSVHLGAIWDWEVSYTDPWGLIRRTIGITVDGMAIPFRDIGIWGEEGVALQCLGYPCNIVDGPNRISFDTPPLAPGLHTATIRIESNSGIPYSYEWAFRVRE